MTEIFKMTGKVSENELEALAGEEQIGGTGLGCYGLAVAITGVAIAVTIAMSGCPTSTCTKSCIWMK